MWLGFCSVEVAPSPKVQLQPLVGPPLDRSLKATVNGWVPLVGVPLKSATGAAGSTVITMLLESDPPGPVTSNIAVKLPSLEYWCVGF